MNLWSLFGRKVVSTEAAEPQPPSSGPESQIAKLRKLESQLAKARAQRHRLEAELKVAIRARDEATSRAAKRERERDEYRRERDQLQSRLARFECTHAGADQ